MTLCRAYRGEMARLPGVPAPTPLTPERLGNTYGVDEADVRVLVADYLGYDYLHDLELPETLSAEIRSVLSPLGERTPDGGDWPVTEPPKRYVGPPNWWK